MKRGKGVHVVLNNTKDGKRWNVELNSKSQKQFETQAEACSFGKRLAKKAEAEFIVHGRDGRILEKNSYGKDPFPPKG